MEVLIEALKSSPPLGRLDMAYYLSLALLLLGIFWVSLILTDKSTGPFWWKVLRRVGYLAIAIVTIMLGLSLTYLISSQQTAATIAILLPEMIDRPTQIPLLGPHSAQQLASRANQVYLAIKVVVIIHFLMAFWLLARYLYHQAKRLSQFALRRIGHRIDKGVNADQAPLD